MAVPPKIRKDVPLAPLTTLGVGGPARFYLEVESEAEVQEALAFAEKETLPVFPLGGGSNLLVSDDGFPGLVLKLNLRGVSFSADGSASAASGESWDDFVAATVLHNLQGLECLSGIPGTVGGAPVQNIAAYGGEVGKVIHSLRVYDRQKKEIVSMAGEACHFRYRESVFNQPPPEGARGRYVILEVNFRLIPGGRPILHYADLKNYFQEESPVLEAVRRAIVEIRAAKGMVNLEGYESFQSVGSFFKNPLVSEIFLTALTGKVSNPYGQPWFWPNSRGGIKISAARLIEEAGFSKGCREGRVGLSPRHTLAVLNYGGATATEILSFARKIQVTVREKFAVTLLPEPELVGFGGNPLG